MSNAQDIKKRD